MYDKIITDLKSKLPEALVDYFFASYREIKENYLLGRHEPSELNGGKLVEASYRIIEHQTKNSFTPVGAHTPDMIGKLRAFENLPSTINESFRVHIPRNLITIYNIRNKRGVGHLGGEVSPNFVDSTLIDACADWVLAELFRIFFACNLKEAQRMVDAIALRPNFLVHDFGDVKRVLNNNLKNGDQVLVLLANEYPGEILDDTLYKWIEPKSKATFINTLLKDLHTKRLIEYKSNKTCVISPKGMKYVDTNYSKFIN